jgi:hypothetical protein
LAGISWTTREWTFGVRCMIEADTVSAGSARALAAKPRQAVARTTLRKLLILQGGVKAWEGDAARQELTKG